MDGKKDNQHLCPPEQLESMVDFMKLFIEYIMDSEGYKEVSSHIY